MNKNILLILGHPSSESYCDAMLCAYKKGAESSGNTCKYLKIADLQFNPNLSDGYKNRETMKIEDDIARAQKLILWSNHIVLAYPTWWGSLPALTKGFIDRVFLPGFAYKYHHGANFPEKLLRGRSIRLLVTMDTPKFWFYFSFLGAQYRMLRQLIFEFVGFSPVKFTTFGLLRKSTKEKRQQWLSSIEKMGKRGL